MKLRIVETNFTNKLNWLFKLMDENGNYYFIMNESFYRKHELRSPITKKELDYFDRGEWIAANFNEIDGERIVVSFE